MYLDLPYYHSLQHLHPFIPNFRNYGIGDTTIKTAIKPVRNKKSEFTLTVNNREVVVTCKNKKDGKHLAAQKLLQQVGNCIRV